MWCWSILFSLEAAFKNSYEIVVKSIGVFEDLEQKLVEDTALTVLDNYVWLETKQGVITYLNQNFYIGFVLTELFFPM